MTVTKGAGEAPTGRRRPGARRDPGSTRAWVVPRDNPLLVLRHGWSLVRSEGPRGLLVGLVRLLMTLRRFVYMERRMRFYHLAIDATAAMPVNAPFDGVHVHIVESPDDAIALAQQGYENLLEVVPGMQRRLAGGAVAACAFVGTQFASIDWMALSDRARQMVDGTPYPPCLAEGEACTGGAFTVRRFRHRGIASYRFGAQVQYLHAKGCRVCYDTIAADNVPSQRVVERYGATFDTVFLQRRIMGRDSFKTVSATASRNDGA